MRKANKESISIAKHINLYLNEHLPFQGYSQNTAKSHEYAISLYLEFLETEKKIVPERLMGECFQQSMIEEWLRWLSEKRKCSPETCNVRLGSLRSFLKFFGGKDVSMLHISEAASFIDRRKQVRKKICGMSKNAVQALMNAPDMNTASGRRDLTLIVALYGTAARINEMLSMKIGQLYLEAKKPYAIIIGKGGKPRTLYLLPKAVAHLKRYIKESHGDSPRADAYVFYSRNGGPHAMMSQSAVSKRLKGHAAKAHKTCPEVPLDIHAHQLRHAKATHWLEEGVNIVQISLLLGHEQLETTMIYLDITVGQKANALATLEDEKEHSTPKKWKGKESTLSGFCGVKSIKK